MKHVPLFLKRMKIQNFRGLTSCEIDFEPDLTVLIGRNNIGKSRILRAIAVGLGTRCDLDDLTYRSTDDAVIDLFFAPCQANVETYTFVQEILARLDAAGPTCEIGGQHVIAWRTKIEQSNDGEGVRASRQRLLPAGSEWRPEESSHYLPELDLVRCYLVHEGRDIAVELFKRGSTIRKVLADLEVSAEERASLEPMLKEVATQIRHASGTMKGIDSSLSDLNQCLDSLGTSMVSPLPLDLETVGSLVSIDFDTGGGLMPARLHGSGTRSLASLQTNKVYYQRRLGVGGPTTRPHPITLVEEPEAHLHPQAQQELAYLLTGLPGQVLASSHSSHLVTVVEPRQLRVLKASSGGRLGSVVFRESDDAGAPRSLRPKFHLAEMEKIRRLVERPLGEILFARVIVVGDGATERAFLPIFLRKVLGARAYGICAVDPGSLDNNAVPALAKLAQILGLPFVVFADQDTAGKDAIDRLRKAAQVDAQQVIEIRDKEGNGCAFEEMFESYYPQSAALENLRGSKGTSGVALAHWFTNEYPEQHDWPLSLKELVGLMQSLLGKCSKQ